MEGPALQSQLPLPSPVLSTGRGSQRPEPPANPSLFPTVSCQERKWGKRWVLFFGPRAWGWPASRQEKGNLERFPLRIRQIMQERRHPQGMRLPAEKALPSPPTTELWGTPGACLPEFASVCELPKTREEDHQDPQNCLNFPNMHGKQQGSHTHKYTSAHPPPRSQPTA